jgi:hypothetical protein
MDTTEISGTKAVLENGLTLAGLIDQYTTHKASNFHKLRYHVRQNSARLA